MTRPPVIVSVTRRYAASAERVFDAWLDPSMIAKFMFGPHLRDESIVHLDVDARVGGAFSFLVRRQETEVDHVGHYLELARPSRLVFTWSAFAAGADRNSSSASRVAIDIVPHRDGCVLTLTHAMPAEWADFAERTKRGWTTMTDALVAALE